MATLHLMVGLPGSGKTTRAKQLEAEYRALRLTPDEWHIHLFGDDFHGWADSAEHDRRHTRVEQLMWQTARRVLALGVDVILDFGCWAREERDAFRAGAYAVGAGFKIHYMDCPREELDRRLQARNAAAGSQPSFCVSRADIDRWSEIFEPPAPDELA